MTAARIVAWFSCGGPSAVAAKLTIASYGPGVYWSLVPPVEQEQE